MSNVVRILAIPAGKKKDKDGRALGDDWLLASFGTDEDAIDYHLTTDYVHASEFGFLAKKLDINPKELAEKVCSMLNDEWERIRPKDNG